MSSILKKIPGFNRFFGGDKGLSPEAKAQIYGQMAAAEGGRTDTESQWRQQLDINYELLHDDGLEKLMEDAMYESVVATTKDVNGVETTKVYPHARINFNMAALREVGSHVNRASFLTKEQAVLTRIKLRCIMKRIKITMRPDQYNLGLSNFLHGYSIWIDFLLSDAEDGRKAKLLKTNPRLTTLQLEEVERNKKGV